MNISICLPSWPIQSECFGHGRCIDNICVCDPGWTGNAIFLNLNGASCQNPILFLTILRCLILIAMIYMLSVVIRKLHFITMRTKLSAFKSGLSGAGGASSRRTKVKLTIHANNNRLESKAMKTSNAVAPEPLPVTNNISLDGESVHNAEDDGGTDGSSKLHSAEPLRNGGRGATNGSATSYARQRNQSSVTETTSDSYYPNICVYIKAILKAARYNHNMKLLLIAGMRQIITFSGMIFQLLSLSIDVNGNHTMKSLAVGCFFIQHMFFWSSMASMTYNVHKMCYMTENLRTSIGANDNRMRLTRFVYVTLVLMVFIGDAIVLVSALLPEVQFDLGNIQMKILLVRIWATISGTASFLHISYDLLAFKRALSIIETSLAQEGELKLDDNERLNFIDLSSKIRNSMKTWISGSISVPLWFAVACMPTVLFSVDSIVIFTYVFGIPAARAAIKSL